MPVQICPAPPPLFRRIGLAIGYWEPMALTDVTRSPGCMVNLGFSLPAFGKTAQGTAKKDEKQVNGAFCHVHWYKYPLTYWLNIITSLGCLEGGDLDIAYLSEIDPTWTDSSLTTILNPEAVIFANPIAQGACAADAIASAFNMPLDVLFWCAGSQGSMYPFNGQVSNESSPLQSSLLVSERMAFKLHRQGMIMETIGKNNAVCNEYPSPILPKERWRYQMVNMYPDSGQCHPFGRSVTRWETGKNPPNTKKNFGYLMWRKPLLMMLNGAVMASENVNTPENRQFLKQQENLSRQLREKPDHQLKAWAEKQVLENPLQRSDNHFLDELVRKQQASQDGKPRQGALYFVSFSIPEEGLKRMLGETRHYGIPATLRGMVNNDLKTTAEAVLSLVKDGATDGVQIDPTLFSQYGIRSVPALVVFCSQGYDIIRGNLRVGQALEKVAATGDCRQVAHDLLAGKGDSGK
ncbi:TrbC Ftype and TraU domain containing protein [Trichuris trichiura]|nr:TrbC Ftype and TraU domain containing protein [Trichuris trichiura]